MHKGVREFRTIGISVYVRREFWFCFLDTYSHEERKTIATPEPTRQESPDQPSGISEGIPPKSPSASERSPRHNHRHINLDLSPETLAKSSSEEKQFRPVTRQRPKSSYHQRSKLSPCSSGNSIMFDLHDERYYLVLIFPDCYDDYVWKIEMQTPSVFKEL